VNGQRKTGDGIVCWTNERLLHHRINALTESFSGVRRLSAVFSTTKIDIARVGDSRFPGFMSRVKAPWPVARRPEAMEAPRPGRSNLGERHR
jgi:hypothetical protein